MFASHTDRPPFGPDDDVAGNCPTCGHRWQGKGREARLVNCGFNQPMMCVECLECKRRTPKTGGRAVPVAMVRQQVLDFQI